ncbi:MAG TPA: hypothetical protein VMS55_12420 [Myxococcota bacterium]|nr:hypothetical protein [Myxococcota bacterium]
MRASLLTCLLSAGLAAFAAAAEEPAAPKAPSPQQVARGTLVMKNLEIGSYSPILDQMHHPATDTEAENAEDRRAISVAFQFLSTRFGKLEGFELAQGPVDCVCVSLGMGPDEYWAKDAETDRGAAVAFTTRYSKIHAGIVRITETNRGRGWIRSIEFGVPPTVPGAKEQVTRITREMIARMQSVTRKPKSGSAPAPKPE